MTENLTDHVTEEQKLLNSVKEGSKIAFSHLYDKYAASLFGIIYGLTHYDFALSEQILHDCFCAIWQNIKKYDASKQRFFTWMICLARNQVSKTLEKKGSEIQKNGYSVGKSNEKNQFADKNSKSALELVCFTGYSIEEAAKKLDICTEDLKLKLRQELNTHRQTSL